MYQNPFVLDKPEYKRDIDVFKHYLVQSATYLSKTTGRSYEEAEAYVKKALQPGGEFEFVDPPCLYTERDETGDRQFVEGSMYKFLQQSIQEEDLISPSLITYLNPKKKTSVLVKFIDDNVKKRGLAKKAMFGAEMAGDMLLYAIKKSEQGNKKISNNSLSGAHVSSSTPLYNKTTHSTLTSACRTTSGYGNANNEKFLSGNRHYWHPDIVLNNITSIICNSDFEKIQAVMVKYNLHVPTVEETMACITYSTDLYWHSKVKMDLIQDYVSKLTDIERAAFVYTGDLYQLKCLNDDFVRQFITRLSRRVNEIHPDPDRIFKETSEDVHILAFQICVEDMRGVEFKKIKGTELYARLASTVENIAETVKDYSDIIRALWVTKNVPASLASFPNSIRRAALTSDTDSTIFTVQDWRLWFQGSYAFTNEAYAVDATMVFLTAQSIVHVLAMMSANFGIETDRIHQIAMKSEFKFDVFVPTQVAKHYFALISCQEGNIFAKYKNEIKGVHLKSSNVSKEIMNKAEAMMEFVMYSVIDGKKISALKLMKEIADIERDIIASVKAGDSRYFRRGLIKTPASYKEKEAAPPYQQYLFWDAVFSDKYGKAPPLPYMSLKISVNLDTPKKTDDWLDSIKDEEFVARVRSFLASQNKRHIGSTMQLPMQNVSSMGVPTELHAVAGIRNIVLDNVKVFYLLLESLGIYVLNGSTTRLLSDEIL